MWIFHPIWWTLKKSRVSGRLPSELSPNRLIGTTTTKRRTRHQPPDRCRAYKVLYSSSTEKRSLVSFCCNRNLRSENFTSAHFFPSTFSSCGRRSSSDPQTRSTPDLRQKMYRGIRHETHRMYVHTQEREMDKTEGKREKKWWKENKK